MPASLLDSAYYRDQYSSPAMREVFGDRARFQSWLNVEIALAQAQEEAGLIPAGIAARIADALTADTLDVTAMKAEFDVSGLPVMPLVRQMVQACDAEAGKYVHRGSTTQDILDTGLVLQMRAGLALLEGELDLCIAALTRMARDHRNTAMTGRTFMQHAAPITFGYKAAVWLDEMLRHKERLPQIRARALRVQCGGAVGTLSAMGPQALAVRAAQARIMGLAEPDISWHSARDGWTECVCWLAMVSATLGKLAAEIATLMRTEINELREPYVAGRGASSAMPQKRNPVACTAVVAIAALMRDKPAAMLGAMVQEHERGVGAMAVEAMIMPEAFLLTSGAFAHLRPVLQGLDVDAAQMLANLQAGGGLIMSHSVMAGLAPHLGNTAAHEVVTQAAQRAIASRTTLRAELAREAAVMAHLSEETLDRLLDPLQHAGAAGGMVDAVLARAAAAAGRAV